MRGGRSSDQKSRGCGKQNDCTKMSTDWTHDFYHRQKRRRAPQELGLYCRKKIIPKPERIAKSFESCCANRAVPAACWTGKEIRGRDCDGFRSKLFLGTDLVAVIPINRRIGRGIVGNFAGCGFVQLSLRALFFLHFALFDALHFFLALLKCRGHKPLLTAECGEGPGPCRPADP
jgi:hypothetical protein